MKKRKPGRPPTPDEEKRKGGFVLRLHEHEHELIKRAAGGKVATWAREVLLRAAKRKV